VLFTWLAMTPEQVAALGLPTSLPKVGNNRSCQGENVQAGAMARIVTTAITDRLDHAAFGAVLGREARIRAELTATLDRLLDEDTGNGDDQGDAP
jgi:hypothetical protein